MNQTNLKLILASNSPRRAELLRSRGYQFEIRCPVLAEPEPRSVEQIASHWAEALSYFKARSVAAGLDDGCVLGADTIVALDDDIIGKPTDRQDAELIIRKLAGTTHHVITGVTLWNVRDRTRVIRHDITTVTMRQMSPQALEDYLNSGLWEGKAGAYGIQDHADANIERIVGSYTNVVGLPMELIEIMLAEVGIYPQNSTPCGKP